MMKIATDRVITVKKVVHDDRWVRAEVVDVLFNNGAQIKDFLRLTNKNGGFVSVAARTKEGQFILTSQCKPVAGKTIESPAGGREPDEALEDTARREMMEEVGYIPGELVRLGKFFYPMSDRADNPCYLFLAFNCVSSEQRIAGDEVQGVESLLLWPPEALQLIERGKIKDLATIAGIFAHLAFERGRR